MLGAGVPYELIDLVCLTSDDVGRLVVDRLGAPVQAELLPLRGERAGCNPFFAEQIFLYLREQGAIALQAGEWWMVSRPQASLGRSAHGQRSVHNAQLPTGPRGRRPCSAGRAARGRQTCGSTPVSHPSLDFPNALAAPSARKKNRRTPKATYTRPISR